MLQNSPFNPSHLLKKVRDLTLIDRNEEQYIVVACDSDGGIGSKLHDTVKVEDHVIGAFAVRVPLFEIIASGAEPFLVIDCLSVEMKGTGSKIIEAIKAYCKPAGLTEDIQFTGSTEDNVTTVQTGIGITVLGLADKKKFWPGVSKAGDTVLCVGVPKSAPRFQVGLEDPEIVTLQELMELRRLPFAGDILPVGYRGVAYEADQLAASAFLQFVPDGSVPFDPFRSAGPSTCVILSVPPEYARDVTAAMSAPVYAIGYLK
jgi:hypothetical protein